MKHATTEDTTDSVRYSTYCRKLALESVNIHRIKYWLGGEEFDEKYRSVRAVSRESRCGNVELCHRKIKLFNCIMYMYNAYMLDVIVEFSVRDAPVRSQLFCVESTLRPDLTTLFFRFEKSDTRNTVCD